MILLKLSFESIIDSQSILGELQSLLLLQIFSKKRSGSYYVLKKDR